MRFSNVALVLAATFGASSLDLALAASGKFRALAWSSSSAHDAAHHALDVDADAAAIGKNHTLPDLALPVTGDRLTKPTAAGRLLPIDETSDFERAQTSTSTETCGRTFKVTSKHNKHERCPDACPLYVQDRTDTDFCTFQCVAPSACVKLNAETQIPDLELGVCRSCVVEGCQTCDNSVATDRCAVCSAGYVLQDGECWFKYGGTWVYVVGGLLGAVFLFVVVWFIEWATRGTCNEAGLALGLKHREAQKMKVKKDESGERNHFPISTNLLRHLVAGPGLMLHFNFQAALIIWALVLACLWMGFATFVDNDLWILGTRKFGTPRMNCILVAWGYETQQRLMWTKVLFLWIVYIFSFLFWMAYGVYQLHSFQEVDFQNKTMKDFVLMIVGMPALPGTTKVEEDLKEALERQCGQELVGVSVAWDWQAYESEVRAAVKDDMDVQETLFKSSRNLAPPDTAEPLLSGVHKFFYKFEQKVLMLNTEDQETTEDYESSEEQGETGGMPLSGATRSIKKSIDEILDELTTSPISFAVFETQEARDAAFERLAGTGFSYEGTDGIQLEELDAEPDTVQWVNFGHSTNKEKAIRLAIGFCAILLACAFWAVVFYAPYAYYVLTFNYDNGRQPGPIVGLSFSMIVVVGNQIMYEVCARISDAVGFRFKDHREACYMILYTIACCFNVALDFVTTYHTAEAVMQGLGFRTYFGQSLKDINSFTTKFETYGMQRSLAENTYSYAFPSTFLIPFLIEPFPLIIAPLLLGKLVVRTHPEVQGRDAEEWVAMVPMEMGRYADLLLNVILGILIFYFPGGYTWMLFLGMAGSHLWIYTFDHYRTLRSTPSCTFAAYDIEWWCQALLAPIMGIIPACLVFKSNCEDNYHHCLKGPPLIAACSAAWFFHTVFHICCLTFVVPKFGKTPPEEDPCKDETFSSLARRIPVSWFTSNPVHCLRSAHIYNHKPPCSNFELGREKYMRPNPKVGVFYEEACKE